MTRKCVLGRRRAVSEIIGTLMILSITVVGAVLISNAMKDVVLPSNSGSSVTDVSPDSIQLIGYDTRDSINLSDVSALNNKFNQLLLTDGATETNKLPSQNGTEFIVLHLRNLSTNSVFLHSVTINNEGHSWDTVAAGQVLDPGNLSLLSGGTISGEVPSDGKFSIIPLQNGTGPSILQKASNEFLADQEVRVIVKLSGNIPQDLGMWDALRIMVNYGGSQPVEFIVLTGDAKW